MCFKTPASPHFAAAIDGVAIDVASLELPSTQRPLVIEGAGGLMVPLTQRTLAIDMFASWRAPLVLCARTALGTINHSPLSIEAIRARIITLLGIVFLGDENAENERIIAELGHTRLLGRLPRLFRLNAATLQAAFSAAFDINDFTGGPT